MDSLQRLSEIVRAERRALVAVARSEGLDAEEAIECVQDALATFLSREEPENPIASLKTIIRNAARNFRRKRRLLAEPDDLPATGPDAEALLAHAEDVVRL